MPDILEQKKSPPSPANNLSSETVYSPEDDFSVSVPAGSPPEVKQSAMDSALALRFPHYILATNDGITLNTPEKPVLGQETPSKQAPSEGSPLEPSKDPTQPTASTEGKFNGIPMFLSGVNALVSDTPFGKGFRSSFIQEAQAISDGVLVQGGQMLQELGNESFVDRMEQFRRDPASILKISNAGGLAAFFGKEALSAIAKHTDIDFEMQKIGYEINDWVKNIHEKYNLNRPEGGADTFAYDLGAGAESLASSMAIGNLLSPAAAGIWFGLKQDAQIYAEATRTMIVKDRATGKKVSLGTDEFLPNFDRMVTDDGVGFKSGQISKDGKYEIVRAPVSPKDARPISALAGIAEGSLEYVGMERMINRIKGFFLKRVIATGLNEAIFNEMPQQLAEELIAKKWLDRPGDALDITKRVLYAGAMGMILGMGGGGFQAALEMKGRKGELLNKGMSPEEADHQINFEHWYANELDRRGIVVAAQEDILAMLKEDAALAKKEALKLEMSHIEGFDAETALKLFEQSGAGETKFQIKEQTKSPEFQKWFKGSQVIDESGNPIVVYHGTNAADFTEFKVRRNKATNTMGAYFTESPSAASSVHGGIKTVKPVFLSISNPLDLRGVSRENIAQKIGLSEDLQAESKNQGLAGAYATLEWLDKKYDIVPQLKKKGYDGIVFDGDHEGVTWVSFDPTQIKSAIGNRGTFDAKNPDILFQQVKEKKARFQGFMDAIKQWYDFRNIIPRDFQLVLADMVGHDFNGFTSLMRQVVAIMKDASVTTVPHEAFHVIFNQALSQEQRTALLAEGGSEEALAERFADFWNNKLAPKTLKEKAKKFLEDLALFLKGAKANASAIDSIFAGITSGKFDHVGPSVQDIVKSVFGVAYDYMEPADLAEISRISENDSRELLSRRLFEVRPELKGQGELPFDEVEKAHGSENARRKRVAKVQKSLEKLTVESKEGPIRLVDSAVNIQYKEVGRFSFPDQRLDSPADYATAFRFLKDEAVEHLYIGAVKKGRVIGVELHTVGTIDQSLADPYEMIDFLLKHHADSFFLVHNHPSGRVQPSREDMEITRKAAAALEIHGVMFIGHAIINDTKFGFFDKNENPVEIEHKQYANTKDVSVLKKYLEWKQGKATLKMAKSPDAMFDIAKGIQLGDGEGLAFVMDKALQIRGTYVIPHGMFTAQELGRMTTERRAQNVVVVNSKLDPSGLRNLKMGLLTQSIRLLDSIDPKANGLGSFTSASTRNLLDPGVLYQKKGVLQIAKERELVQKEIDGLIKAEVDFLQEAYGDMVGGKLMKRYSPTSEGDASGETYFRQALPKEIKHPLTGNKPVNPTQWKVTALRNLERGWSQYTPEYDEVAKAVEILKGQMQEAQAREAQEIQEFRDRMSQEEQDDLRAVFRAEEVRHYRQLEIFEDESGIMLEHIPNYLAGIDATQLKDISGITANFKDVFRIFKKVFPKNFQQMEEGILDPLDESVTRYYKLQKQLTDELYSEIVQKLGIKKGSRESAAVMLWGEHQIEDEQELVKAFGQEMTDKVILADKWFRTKYNQLVEAVNESRKEIYPNNPKKLIPFRWDYYRHFHEFSNLKSLVNLFDTPANISPALAGTSEFMKPRSKWASFMQTRKGDTTTYDAVGGFLDYIPAASYSIFVDPNIAVFRALSKQIKTATADSKNLNTFIQFLEGYANDLAGKTSWMDRAVLNFFGEKQGRVIMRGLNFLNGRAKANIILGNFGSTVAQVFNVPQAVGQFKGHAAQAFIDSIKGNPEQAKSQFLNNRYADSMFDKFDTTMLRDVKKFAKWMLTFGDEVATRFSWNGFYRQGLAQNVQDAIAFADKQTRSCVGGRSVGEVPILQKSKVFQLIAPFQLEVTNLWWSLGDMRRKKDFVGLLVFAVMMRMMNYLAEQARGSRVALDPLLALWEASQPDKTMAQRAGRIMGEFFGNIPFGNNLVSQYPEFGFSPFGFKLPTRRQLFGTEATRFSNSPLIALSALRDPIFSFLLPFGGKQVNKTLRGFRAWNYGSFDFGKKPIYLEQSTQNLIKGALFGPYAINEVKQYLDEMSKRLEKIKDDNND